MFMNYSSYTTMFVVVALMSLGFGCAEDKPHIPQSDRASDKLRIVFKWAGDDMATRQELEMRERIVRQIEQEGFGKLIRMGTGMGWMDLVLALEDREDGRRNIEQVIRELSPDSGMTVQVEENRDN